MIDLLTPSLTKRLDSEIFQQWPNRRGWFFIDASNAEADTACVHVRPYLRCENSPPGFKIEQAEAASLTGNEDQTYIMVFACPTGREIARKAEELMLDSQRRSLPWLALEIESDGSAVSIIRGDGSKKRLSPKEPPLQAGRINLVLGGNANRQVSKFLPLEITVSADAPSAVFSISVPESSGFSQKTYYFLVRNKHDKPLREGYIRLDARLQAGGTDKIEISASGFSSAVEIDEWMSPPVGEENPRFHDGPLVLHIIYDRTTLDAESWTTAFAALRDGLQVSDDDVYGARTVEISNSRLRENLAAALAEAAPQLHHDVSFCTWWFADTPREGIAASESLVWLKEACGWIGHCSTENLRNHLCAPSMGYATGLDMFDSVDEALSRVEEYIRENKLLDQQHAVLIVGDSPPPPSDQQDVLWKYLVEKPVRTAARRSSLFINALNALNEEDVPVGWLFIRASHPPDDSPFNDHLIHFQYFQTLKERVLMALRQIDGLIIEGFAEASEMRNALGRLFHKMAFHGLAIRGFRILKIK
jgi:hypothetical protein